MTANGEERAQIARPVADDLEAYRRLIRIQRQLVQMSKQHEQTRREFEALREQVAREVIGGSRRRTGLRHRLRRAAARLLKRLARRAADTPVRTLNRQQPSSC